MAASKTLLVPVVALIAFIGLLTLPIWGMGPAVFLDSDRTILSRQPSPDDKRIAQVERLVVGGVPSIVVIVRDWWMPNWYLSGCAAASHYEDTDARVSWTSDAALTIHSEEEARFWTKDGAPFHSHPCAGVATTIITQES